MRQRLLIQPSPTDDVDFPAWSQSSFLSLLKPAARRSQKRRTATHKEIVADKSSPRRTSTDPIRFTLLHPLDD